MINYTWICQEYVKGAQDMSVWSVGHLFDPPPQQTARLPLEGGGGGTADISE